MDRVKYYHMADGDAEDYHLATELFAKSRCVIQHADAVMDHLKFLLGDDIGHHVDRFEHSLQTATRALRDDRPEDYVVMALFHDIGDTLSPHNHGDIAAGILKPYVTEEQHFIVKNHAIFQGYYFWHLDGQARDRNARDVHGGEETDITRGDAVRGGEAHIAFHEVLAPAADVAAGLRRFDDDDGIRVGAVGLGVLLHHDGIRAGGHEGAGEDAYGLADAERAFPRMTGAGLADDFKRERNGGDVFVPDRVAIHGRDIGGRMRDGGAYVFGEDTVEGARERDVFDVETRKPVDDHAAGVGDGD